MTDTATFTPQQVSLHELGLDTPEECMLAWQSDPDTITAVVHDPDGGYHTDPPNEDHSGENAFEWIEFSNGQRRNEWLEDNTLTRHDFLIERYEHGLVNYGLCCYPGSGLPGDPSQGESSPFDRQWDVAPGVAVLRFKPDPEIWGASPDFVEMARGICKEYTNWCNGSIYGLIRFERKARQVGWFTLHEWHETDSSWGYIGDEYAEECAKTGDW